MPVLLLIEDHADTRAMYAEFLREAFQVIEAADGEEALAALRERVPDLVITDLSLPRIDGLAIVRQIRSNPSTSAVPVICLSGYGDADHEQRALEAGCDRLLQKPCLPDELGQAAMSLLRGRGDHQNI